MPPSANGELVDIEQVARLIAICSGVALVLAAVLLGVLRRRTGLTGRRVGQLALGVAFVYPLWWVFNAIEDGLGLDSVAALLINVVLFAGVGAGAGLLYRRFWPAPESGGDPGKSAFEE